jgi:hypothetical protein
MKAFLLNPYLLWIVIGYLLFVVWTSQVAIHQLQVYIEAYEAYGREHHVYGYPFGHGYQRNDE